MSLPLYGFEIFEEFGWHDKNEIENRRELIMVSKKRAYSV
jgi:hypothetical protein